MQKIFLSKGKTGLFLLDSSSGISNGAEEGEVGEVGDSIGRLCQLAARWTLGRSWMSWRVKERLH